MLRAALAACLVLAAGCLEAGEGVPGAPPPTPAEASAADNVTDGLPPYWSPQLPLRALEVRATAETQGGGSRVRFWDGHAYVSSLDAEAGVAIFDVADPMRPQQVGVVEGIAPHEGIEVLVYGNRVVLALSDGPGGIAFVDVTDPAEPRELRRIDLEESHSLGALRSAHVVYNAGWVFGQPGGTEIIDASDPDDVRLAGFWAWGGRAADGTPLQPSPCHDLHIDQAAARAYCAGQVQTTVWDLSDPLAPVALTAITTPVPHHNTAFPIRDGRTLVIGQEETGCTPDASAAATAAATPTGLWFYDLESTPPRPAGWLSLPSGKAPVYPTCAPHLGSEVVPGSGFLAFSWYDEGLVLVDASDPARPRVLDRHPEIGFLSDAASYRGLVFAAGDGGLHVAYPVG